MSLFAIQIQADLYRAERPLVTVEVPVVVVPIACAARGAEPHRWIRTPVGMRCAYCRGSQEAG